MDRIGIIGKPASLLVAGIMVILFFSCGCYSCMSDLEQVETARKQIPEAAEFISDNKEFLDMLLDIQKRIRSLNEDKKSSTDDNEPGIIGDYRISIYKDELSIIKFDENFSSPRSIEEGNEYDILTTDEKQLIKNKLLEMSHDEHPRIIRISMERVSMSFYYYERATIYIESPAVEFEHHYGDSYVMYKYSEKVNSDWCVYLEKAGYD